MSTCTCYFCDGTGETADGYDSTWGDSRTTTCRHCGGSGQEPERDEAQPFAPPDCTPHPGYCVWAARLIAEEEGPAAAKAFVDRHNLRDIIAQETARRAGQEVQ